MPLLRRSYGHTLGARRFRTLAGAGALHAGSDELSPEPEAAPSARAAGKARHDDDDESELSELSDLSDAESDTSAEALPAGTRSRARRGPSSSPAAAARARRSVAGKASARSATSASTSALQVASSSRKLLGAAVSPAASEAASTSTPESAASALYVLAPPPAARTARAPGDAELADVRPVSIAAAGTSASGALQIASSAPGHAALASSSPSPRSMSTHAFSSPPQTYDDAPSSPLAERQRSAAPARAGLSDATLALLAGFCAMPPLFDSSSSSSDSSISSISSISSLSSDSSLSSLSSLSSDSDFSSIDRFAYEQKMQDIEDRYEEAIEAIEERYLAGRRQRYLALLQIVEKMREEEEQETEESEDDDDASVSPPPLFSGPSSPLTPHTSPVKSAPQSLYKNVALAPSARTVPTPVSHLPRSDLRSPSPPPDVAPPQRLKRKREYHLKPALELPRESVYARTKRSETSPSPRGSRLGFAPAPRASGSATRAPVAAGTSR